jgi:hypothetical protein
MTTWAQVQEGGPNRLGERLASDIRVTRHMPAERVKALMESTDHVGEAERWALAFADQVERYLDRGE